MLTDAHFHPFDLIRVFPEFESEYKMLFSKKETGILAMASACDIAEFTHNEELARNFTKNCSSALLLSFGIHPQQLAVNSRTANCQTANRRFDGLLFDGSDRRADFSDLLEYLDILTSEKRIVAVGEIGFDLYNSVFKETESFQDHIFAAQLEIALKNELPVVLHVRRATHKIFALAKTLSKCKAVVFHSWSGNYEEAESLLRKGVNVYFSFGNTVTLNRKQAKRTCALLPAERLLTETDAPYQPRREQVFSQWADLPLILDVMTALRCEAGNDTTIKELENQIEKNFKEIFFDHRMPRMFANS
jgi:TatD DNase family protein